MSGVFPQTLYVGGNSIRRYAAESWEEIKRDPRGLVLMFEPPIPGAKYVVGLDSSEGLTGWNRHAKVQGDDKIDNSAIEVFRVDGARELLYKEENGRKVPIVDPRTQQQAYKYKDVQACEFAGPVDAVEAARIANILGRIYAGDEQDQALLILESWPGCGMLAMQELFRLGYSNLWQWEYFADGPVEQTKWVGWRSTDRSQRLLWQRTSRHLKERRVVIRSKFLRGEYGSAVSDPVKMRAIASNGKHDDRMQAANMALWASHGWTYDIERTEELVMEKPIDNYQNYAPGLDDYVSYDDWRATASESFED